MALLIPAIKRNSQSSGIIDGEVETEETIAIEERSTVASLHKDDKIILL